MAISKVILNGVTQMDATIATATAADIIAPMTAMLADGVVTTGTGSGGSEIPDGDNLGYGGVAIVGSAIVGTAVVA